MVEFDLFEVFEGVKSKKKYKKNLYKKELLVKKPTYIYHKYKEEAT